MTIFQVDENFRDKKFIEACNKGGPQRVWGFPSKMLGLDDEIILPHFMALDKPLVTNDVRIVELHLHCVQRNPGIIVVCYAKHEGNTRTATIRRLSAIILNFKKCCPWWFLQTYDNSIIQVTDQDVTVWHMNATEMVRDEYLPFVDSSWPQTLRQRLELNASRYVLPKTTPPDPSAAP